MTDELQQRRYDVAIAHAVYNAVSLTGRDMQLADVRAFLIDRWQPFWGPGEDILTSDAIAKAGDYLAKVGLCRLDDDKLVIPVRDPRTRCGRHVERNRQDNNLSLTWKGKA